VFRIAIHDLITTNVREVVLQNFFTQKINESLNIFCHFLLSLCLFQGAEVNIRKCALEELNVKLVAEKDRDVINLVLDS